MQTGEPSILPVPASLAIRDKPMPNCLVVPCLLESRMVISRPCGSVLFSGTPLVSLKGNQREIEIHRIPTPKFGTVDGRNPTVTHRGIIGNQGFLGGAKWISSTHSINLPPVIHRGVVFDTSNSGDSPLNPGAPPLLINRTSKWISCTHSTPYLFLYVL